MYGNSKRDKNCLLCLRLKCHIACQSTCWEYVAQTVLRDCAVFNCVVSGHIVAVDSVSPTIFLIDESGGDLKWIDCSDYMREPSDIAAVAKEYFVCDFKVGTNCVFFIQQRDLAC